MIETMKESQGNVVGFHVTGTLHERDYEELLPKLEALFTEHGKLRLLFYADPEFKGWDLSAAWQDAGIGLRHRADFERMAIVGAPDWVNQCVRLAKFLFKGEAQIFAADALEQAWAWVKG